MFEYDLVKSKINSDKHGIDFMEAEVLWEDPNRIVISARSTYESRFLLIAEREGTLWSTVYTSRGENIRIISVREVLSYEKRGPRYKILAEFHSNSHFWYENSHFE